MEETSNKKSTTIISQENSIFVTTVDRYCNLIVELRDHQDEKKNHSPITGETKILQDCENEESASSARISSEKGISQISNENNNISRSSESVVVPSIFQNSTKSIFSFEYYLTRNVDGTTSKLSLNGNDILKQRGRCLDDSDMEDLLLFLHDHDEIVWLDVSFNKIRCGGFIDLIDYIALSNQIIYLDVQQNEIKSKGIYYLYESRCKLQLQILKLSGNKFGVESSKQIALMLHNNEYLCEINVASVDQTISSLVYFTTVLSQAQDFNNCHLRKLDISSPNPPCSYFFDTAHFASLIGSMLKSNNSLENLYLQKYGFSCHDIALMMEEGKFNKTLFLLDLTGNNIGDYGVESIADWMAERPALSHLILARNIVTTVGASTISRGLPLSKIQNLDISYNRIGDSGISEILNSIKKKPLLKGLRIFGNCIGHESSKIINRMLLSKVLNPKTLDVRPFRVNHIWSCAFHFVESQKRNGDKNKE